MLDFLFQDCQRHVVGHHVFVISDIHRLLVSRDGALFAQLYLARAAPPHNEVLQPTCQSEHVRHAIVFKEINSYCRQTGDPERIFPLFGTGTITSHFRTVLILANHQE